MTELIGKNLLINWITTGGTIDLSGDFRAVGYNPSVKLLNITTGSATFEDYLVLTKDTKVSYRGVMQTTVTTIEDSLEAGTFGTLIIQPEGTISCKRKYTIPAFSLGGNVNWPFDDTVEISCDFQGAGTPTISTNYLGPLLDLFTGDGGQVGIERVGTSYWLYSPIQDGRYHGTKLTPFTVSGKTDIAVSTMEDRIPMASVKDNNATYAVKTGTWTNDAAQALAYGGTYSFCLTAGGYITFTTPANVKRVGIRHVKTTNAGLVLVSIDGDNTLADLLSTAQDLVDAGTFPNTILVANGGTLNPTDRVIDMYSAAADYDVKLKLANDLTAGVHTIVLSYTGYKRDASSATRLYITGMYYNGTSVTVATAGIFMETQQLVGAAAGASVYEAVQHIKPTGATNSEWVGHGHGNTVLNSTVITVDGVAVTPADGSITAGTVISFARNSSLYHSEIGAGATIIGTSITTYYPTATEGLRITTQTTWALGGVTITVYPAMFPTGIFMEKGANIALPGQSVTLSADDESKVVNAKSPAGYVYDSDGYYAALLYTPDLALNVSDYSQITGGYYLFTQDRSVATFNKIYQTKIDNVVPVAYAIGEVWNSDAQWRIFRRANTLTLPL